MNTALHITNSPLKQLQNRGLIAQTTGEAELEQLLTSEATAVYCGFDPTADSLHLGHLLPLLCLKRFQQSGHTPILLIGGATGMIGDPSFKASERQLNTTNTVHNWSEKIRVQAELLLDFDCKNNPAKIVNNWQWFKNINCIDFLRDIGKHFSVNAMISKESVKQRINRDETGISFTEFSYALLQSYDFVKLNTDYGAKLQIGGSDQWGNITSGIDLTRRINQKSVFGLTVPLITKSDGTKFGKTEGGSIWLDRNKTSPYKFYQFWLNTPDFDVYRFLNYFTFLSYEEILAIEADDKLLKGAPQAQKILARELTRLVHGDSDYQAVLNITQCLFNNEVTDLDINDLQQLAKDGMPTTYITNEENLQEVLVKTELATSKKRARTLIESNGILINGTIQNDTEHHFKESERLFGKYTLIRRGKKQYHLVIRQ